jgi:hypothetical protein
LDEPQVQAPGRGSIRYTPDLFDQFRKRWGYDLETSLPSIYEETGDWKKVRHNYYQLVLELFIERWSNLGRNTRRKDRLDGPLHGWQVPHGGQHGDIRFPTSRASMLQPVQQGVNAVRQCPQRQGTGDVANQLAAAVPSAKPMEAAVGSTFEDMKRLGDWEYVLGVT